MEKASELFNSILKAPELYYIYIPNIHPVQLPVRQETSSSLVVTKLFSLQHTLFFSALRIIKVNNRGKKSLKANILDIAVLKPAKYFLKMDYLDILLKFGVVCFSLYSQILLFQLVIVIVQLGIVLLLLFSKVQ